MMRIYDHPVLDNIQTRKKVQNGIVVESLKVGKYGDKRADAKEEIIRCFAAIGK